MVQKKGGQRQSGNPAKRASGASTSSPSPTPPTGWRMRLERTSAPVLLTLSRMPRWAFPLIMAALLVGGLMINPAWIGGILLIALVAVLVWLTALSWPVLSTTGRILRVITVGAALAVAFARLTGRL